MKPLADFSWARNESSGFCLHRLWMNDSLHSILLDSETLLDWSTTESSSFPSNQYQISLKIQYTETKICENKRSPRALWTLLSGNAQNCI